MQRKAQSRNNLFWNGVITMRFVIKHEIKGRIRIHLVQKRMTLQQADILQYYLEIQENIETARIQERTCDATICYHGSRNAILDVMNT